MAEVTIPLQHSPVLAKKIGVLLVNLGTPDATDYWSMRRYLSEFLSDQRVIDYPRWLWQPLLQGVILTTRPRKSGHAYAQIWNTERDESPLRTHTRAITEGVASELNAPELVVDYAMRYGNPSIASKLDALRAQGCDRVVLFALYPQYSACTTATVYDKAFAHLQTLPWQPAIRTACAWHDDPAYIQLLAQSVTTHLATLASEPEVILTSFHGLPQRYLKQGDPYHCFCCKTSRLLREALNWPTERWVTTFQSRFGPEQWLQPYTDETVTRLAQSGTKHLAILSPAFVTDCVETLEEINIGLRETFLEHGGETFTYIPCLNDSPAHVRFLVGRVRQELSGWWQVSAKPKQHASV